MLKMGRGAFGRDTVVLYCLPFCTAKYRDGQSSKDPSGRRCHAVRWAKWNLRDQTPKREQKPPEAVWSVWAIPRKICVLMKILKLLCLCQLGTMKTPSRPILHQTASVRFTILRADNVITGIVMGTGCYWSGIGCAGRDCARGWYGTREQEEPGEVSPDAASSAAHVPVCHLIPIP